MVTRTYQATGEALLVPARNYRKRSYPITSNRWEMGIRQEGGGGARSSCELG